MKCDDNNVLTNDIEYINQCVAVKVLIKDIESIIN